MTEKPRETQAELHVVELKEKVNNSSLMKHPLSPRLLDQLAHQVLDLALSPWGKLLPTRVLLFLEPQCSLSHFYLLASGLQEDSGSRLWPTVAGQTQQALPGIRPNTGVCQPGSPPLPLLPDTPSEECAPRFHPVDDRYRSCESHHVEDGRPWEAPFHKRHGRDSESSQNRECESYVTASVGVGKTFLACAFAQQAIRQGHTAFYTRQPVLFRELSIARADGTLHKRLAKLARVDILIVDDFAMTALVESERRDFLEICEDRYNTRSTILTSQIPIADWHQQIGDPTLADSILDRLVHNAHRLQLAGGSMRKRLAASQD